MSWRWIDQRMLTLLHDESLAEHGGSAGLRDEGLLESPLARPRKAEQVPRRRRGATLKRDADASGDDPWDPLRYPTPRGAPDRRSEAPPLNLAAYGDPDFADLAAAYGIGLAKNHPFVDGNKRAAFLAVGMFLALNGYRLAAAQADATLTMLSVAAGELDETAFADWIRTHSQKR